MKFLLKIAVVLLPFFVFSATAQSVGDDITKALSKGNVKEVSKFFDSTVDITIGSTSNTYSKSQAEQVLKSFFDQNQVTSFNKLHNVSSRGGDSVSFIGKMMAGGKEYRVYVLLANSASHQIIQELSIRER